MDVQNREPNSHPIQTPTECFYGDFCPAPAVTCAHGMTLMSDIQLSLPCPPAAAAIQHKP
jgi:hypothetical protein